MRMVKRMEGMCWERYVSVVVRRAMVTIMA